MIGNGEILSEETREVNPKGVSKTGKKIVLILQLCQNSDMWNLR